MGGLRGIGFPTLARQEHDEYRQQGTSEEAQKDSPRPLDQGMSVFPEPELVTPKNASIRIAHSISRSVSGGTHPCRMASNNPRKKVARIHQAVWSALL